MNKVICKIGMGEFRRFSSELKRLITEKLGLKYVTQLFCVYPSAAFIEIIIVNIQIYFTL